MMGIVSIILWALVITLGLNYLLSASSTAKTEEILYSQFLQMIREDKVEKVIFESNKITITPKKGVMVTPLEPETSSAPAESILPGLEPVAVPEAQKKKEPTPPDTYYCAPLNDTAARAELYPLLDEHEIVYGTPYVEQLSPIIQFLVSWILPMALMMILLSVLFKSMSGKMGGGLGGVGKANAKVYVEKKTGVTFADVAGQDEAKESLVEIIDFLHNPTKYTEIGAKLPKGALLVGSPGTGKTLLAKAVAGEAKVPFFSISGSDFVEMFVGVGASRVRDLFKEAAKMAPCIIFIDEIDTIGKSRDNRMGGNDEREQTLNQLLAELDGFDPTKGVIVLAATNRPEVLDKALLRPGRFDRRITVDRPNLAGRLATLQVHTRNIRLSEDVDLNKIAQATAGTVGADLANLVNEAALRAVRLGRRAVNQQDLLVSFEMVIAGSEKKGTVLTEQEKKLIAYHEVGHAMVAARQKNAQPVSKITIVPHTQGALGYTMQLPEEEKFLMSKEDLLTEIRTLLAGRSAEEVVFSTQTSGAANDIERATDLARKMVTMFGMSDKFGMMGLATIQNQYLEGGYGLNCAQETAAVIDQEVRDIIDTCHREAVTILEENRDMLDSVAGYLLQRETITGGEMMAILAG
ncbi:MAG: ATP-dependent metallopeptidase FtsH/Yme1/Tma family protein, partial [Clostridia bacterium]|nr:ATP-dependent metallopeptidase FtsH/Yme1/Tma family protein [Clostridia bacterium]